MKVLTENKGQACHSGTFCMTIFVTIVWDPIKSGRILRHAGRVGNSLVLETSEWILSPTPDEAKKKI